MQVIPFHFRLSSRTNLCSVCLRRHLSASSALSSGHSKWATIKHDKARNDASRGRQRAALAKEISDACKASGPDPTFNPKLVDAIAKAKRAGFPKSGIETAILRGQGKSSSGMALESLTVEMVLPPVALIVEALTENKARTLQDVRTVLKAAGGQATPTTYLFDKKGRITFARKESSGLDDVLESSLEAGALDIFEDENGRLVVDTEPNDLKRVETYLIETHALEVDSSDTIWLPNPDTKVENVDAESLSQLLRLEEDLHGISEVQCVYMNTDLSAQQPNAVA